MTAPPSNLPRKHLHTIPHGTVLPDGATVEDGYPFLLEVSGVRTLYQNNNGTFELVVEPGLPTGGTTGQLLAKVSGTDGDAGWEDPPSGGGGTNPMSIDGTEWVMHLTRTGVATPVPVEGSGNWVIVDNFDVPGNPAFPPWSRPFGTMSVDSLYFDSSDLEQGALFVSDGADSLIHHTALIGLPAGPLSQVRAHATVLRLPGAGKTMALFVRGPGDPTPGDNYYAAVVDPAGALTLVERLAGVETVKETHPGTVVVGDMVSISAGGSTGSAAIIVYLTHAGVTTASTTFTDTDFGGSQSDVGIRMDGGAWARYGLKDISSPGSDLFL